jgi:DNA invertase Pin-like site-specific DNA recombinase
MAEAKKDKDEAVAKGQGRAVTLPNGVRRIDFIRDAYYKDGKSRSDIRKEINEMLEKAKRGAEVIPYQIVFAATKTEGDPRDAVKADKGSGKK